jgi:CRISPR-associated endonuclease/helicase Cas3
MPLLAHSARPNKGIPAQGYLTHIANVESFAKAAARAAAEFWTGDRQWFEKVVARAAHWHDFGKLDPLNQDVLAGMSLGALPVGHEHAGVKYLMSFAQAESAGLVYSHHRGLPDLIPELQRFPSTPFYDESLSEKQELALERAESQFERYLESYRQCFPEVHSPEKRDGKWRIDAKRWTGLTWRFALSCLVDADHSDTARHYGQEVVPQPIPPKWAERLEALDRYVGNLGKDPRGDPKRNSLRREIYDAARANLGEDRICACDSGVGTGKTTAVMAHLLSVAERRKLRHIFVVLPYTNIIKQAVKVYRNAFTLPGEDSRLVVGEHHHQAEFQSPELRQLSTLWDCPITVTTAVQFFETMASAKPAKLRKFHELAGSAIFIDEAHAAIPAHLWPQTWLWLQELTRDWGCHVVLASGSLVRFWEHSDFVTPPVSIPDLLPAPLRKRNLETEGARVSYKLLSGRLGVSDLLKYVSEPDKGPWLVIVNTVHSAATIAKSFHDAGKDVAHLSTALAPLDRDIILENVAARLTNKDDRNWILVATSCVEAGADLSFRAGIRELAATSSMLQIAGRINRHGEESGNESIVSVVRFDDPNLTKNPSMKTAGQVLEALFEAGKVNALDASSLCTEALSLELREANKENLAEIKRAEEARSLKTVDELYNVIADETITVLVNPALKRFEDGEQLRSIDIVRGSVRLRKKAAEKFAVRPVAGSDELYAWTLDYDPKFLGYMEGALKTNASLAGEFMNA